MKLFIVSRGVTVSDLAREAGISRNHVRLVASAEREPSRRKMATIVSAARRLTFEPVRTENLFELTAEESGTWFLAKDRNKAIRAAAASAAQLKLARERLIAVAHHRPVSEWPTRLMRHPQGVNVALIRSLLTLAYRTLDAEPRLGDEIADVAASLVAALPDTVTAEVKVMIRAVALLYRAYASRSLGRYDEAAALLDAAEREAERTPYCANELARVWYECAALCVLRGDVRNAERHANRAITLFTVLGDVHRVGRTQNLMGSVRYVSGDVAAARDLWLAAYDRMRTAEDKSALAGIARNLGAAETLVGNVDEARNWLDESERMFVALRLPTELTRVRWAKAKLQLVLDRGEGVSLLKSVRAEFVRRNMPTDAGFVGLDIVEALLDDESRSEDLIALARATVGAFEKAGATPRMLEALSYLRQAVQRQRATSELVGEVRDYLAEALRGTNLPFAPRDSVTASESTTCSTE
ncbi:MAG TPA: hypothetical protein VF824_01875 [Thermoanaerobaculia bacterium]